MKLTIGLNENIQTFFLTENYFLHGTEEGKYSLMSPILHEKGKRWFYPHFGFAYKAINAKVKVIFVSDVGGDNSQSVLLDQSYNEHNTNWEYFFTEEEVEVKA